MQLGSIARVKRPLKDGKWRGSGRALVVDHEELNGTIVVGISFEPLAVLPIAPCHTEDFLVVPKKLKAQAELEEIAVNIHEVDDLLIFEQEMKQELPNTSKHSFDAISIGTWKERGDSLLRLGDASSAASYYERGLFQSNRIAIGGTVIISVQGFPKLAEVDCIEQSQVDVTIVETGDDHTLSKSSILLCVLDADHEKLQERILLNLARCMLQLAELDATNKSEYHRAAVLATSLVCTINSCREALHETSSQQQLLTSTQTALVLRAKAQIGLSNWPQAKQDANQLLNAGNHQGTKLLSTIDRKRKSVAKTNKKLAKEMCRLIQTSTAKKGSMVSPSNASPPSNSVLPGERALNSTPILTLPGSTLRGLVCFLGVPLAAAALVSYLYADRLSMDF